MKDEPDTCELSEEDLTSALEELRTYVDVTLEDLKTIYRVAQDKAKLRKFGKVPVKNAMTTEVTSITGDADLQKVMRLMTEKDIGGLPVVDPENRVIGMVTKTDVLSMAGVDGPSIFRNVINHLTGELRPKPKTGMKVEEFMTAPAISITSDEEVEEAARIMDKKEVKRLPVVDEKGKLVGIITRTDIVRVIARK